MLQCRCSPGTCATCCIAGHDWGTPIACHAALVRPDRFGVVTDRDDQRHNAREGQVGS
jgi:hypothetical protein